MCAGVKPATTLTGSWCSCHWWYRYAGFFFLAYCSSVHMFPLLVAISEDVIASPAPEIRLAIFSVIASFLCEWFSLREPVSGDISASQCRRPSDQKPFSSQLTSLRKLQFLRRGKHYTSETSVSAQDPTLMFNWLPIYSLLPQNL